MKCDSTPKGSAILSDTFGFAAVLRESGISHVDEVRFQVGGVLLTGNLTTPREQKGIVLFAHGSGSGRHSRRNQYVAAVLQESGLATLLFDLLTKRKKPLTNIRHISASISDCLPIGWLARLIGSPRSRARPVSPWATSEQARVAERRLSRRLGVRIWLVPLCLEVADRTWQRSFFRRCVPRRLLIVGGDDEPVIGMNEYAVARLGARVKDLVIVPGASHLFEEPGKLDEVARLAADWLTKYLDLPAEAQAD